MNYYRISKYSPKYRINGIYRKDEWTSIFDVGKTFDGVMLTMSEYERVERNHLRFLRELCQVCGVQTSEIKGMEKYDEDIVWSDGMSLDIDQTERICRDILREKCWCRLEAEDMHIDFGYEYYMYVGCKKTKNDVDALAKAHGLYAEEWYEEKWEEIPVSRNFSDYFWADSQVEKIEIQYDHVCLSIFHDVSGQMLKVVCRGLAGVNNVCIWDDCIISQASCAAAREEDPFMRQLYAAYNKDTDYGGRRLDEGMMELKISLVNGIGFSIYCQSVEVVSE